MVHLQESVVLFDRNGWSTSTGISGPLRQDYAHEPRFRQSQMIFERWQSIMNNFMNRIGAAISDMTGITRDHGGWSDFFMVRRYAHLGAEHLAEYADNIATLKTGTNLAQAQSAENDGKINDC